MRRMGGAALAAGRAFVLAALLLVTLDAGLSMLSGWPRTSFPSWAGNRVNEKVDNAAIDRGERLYGPDKWFELTSEEGSTLHFRLAIMIKLKLVVLASVLAGAAAGVVAFVRTPPAGNPQTEPPGEAARPAGIPLGILVSVLAVTAVPFGSIAGFVCYILADRQRRGGGGLPRERKLLLAYQVACAFVVVMWALLAQIPWGPGWSEMYPRLFRLLGG